MSLRRLPVPREHGAWMMLYTPLVVTLAVQYPFAIGPAMAITAAVTAAFLLQNIAGMLLRGRRELGLRPWGALLLALLATAAAILIGGYGRANLLWLALPVLALFSWHGWYTRHHRHRVNRGWCSELATVAVLALSGPAAQVAVRGDLNGQAWHLWVACVCYFSSSVFYVKMLVRGAQLSGSPNWSMRWRIGRPLVVYHVALGLLVSGQCWRSAGGGEYLVLAFAPAILRALVGWSTLRDHLPSLRAVGVKEILFATWFGVFIVVHGRHGGAVAEELYGY